MSQDISEYITLDGVPHHIDAIEKMAMNCGSYLVAEHYMNAVMEHALLYQRLDFLERVRKIKTSYNVQFIDRGYGNPASGNNMPRRGGLQHDPNVIARKIYQEMGADEQNGVLKDGLALLRQQKEELFNKPACWMGIVLVVSVRLDQQLKMAQLYNFACKVMPDDWPDSLKAKPSTSSNFSRRVGSKDREKPYYEMETNPWRELCDKYWETVRQLLLQKNTK